MNELRRQIEDEKKDWEREVEELKKRWEEEKTKVLREKEQEIDIGIKISRKMKKMIEKTEEAIQKRNM